VSASSEQKKYGLGFGCFGVFDAKCGCGFHQSLTSGNLSREVSHAPYFCVECGLVSLNIREEPHRCPWCKSEKVKPYGFLPISLLPSLNDKKLPVICRREYKIYQDGHLCPECKQMSLSFFKTKDAKVRPI